MAADVQAPSPPQPLPPLRGLRAFVLSLRRRSSDRGQHAVALCRELGLDYELVEALDGRSLQSREASKMEHVRGCTYKASWLPDAVHDPAWSRQHPRAGASYVRVAEHREDVERWCVLACLLGHDEILRRVESEGLEYALVLEDDCLPQFSTSAPSTRRRRSVASQRRSESSSLEAAARWQPEPSNSPVWTDIRERYAAGAAWIGKHSESWKLVFLGGTLGFRGNEASLRVATPGYDRLLVQGLHTYQAHAYMIRRDAIAPVRERLTEGFAADAALQSAMAKVLRGAGCWRFAPSLLRQPGTTASRDSDITGNRIAPQRMGRSRSRLPATRSRCLPTPEVVQDLTQKLGEYGGGAAVEASHVLLALNTPGVPEVCLDEECDTQWNCKRCTLVNSLCRSSCDACAAPRRTSVPPPDETIQWAQVMKVAQAIDEQEQLLRQTREAEDWQLAQAISRLL